MYMDAAQHNIAIIRSTKDIDNIAVKPNYIHRYKLNLINFVNECVWELADSVIYGHGEYYERHRLS